LSSVQGIPIAGGGKRKLEVGRRVSMKSWRWRGGDEEAATAWE